MNRHLLLDFDGVILKNRILTQYQLNRSARFVTEKTGLKLNLAKKVNYDFYPKYGHTVTMLNEMFSTPVTLQEYNDYVFDPNILDYLQKYICRNTYNNGYEFNKVIDFCEKNNTKWYIYTNAHINWVSVFSKSVNLHIPSDKIIYPLHMYNLKPNQKSYDSIENKFSQDAHFIFVDDQKNNLPICRKRWSCYHYSSEKTTDDIIEYINKIF